MPFGYYGGKKQLARYYPPPNEHTIIEPFAGSAGYALHWATPAHHVILIEKDAAIVALWRRLQAPDAHEDVANVVCPPAGHKGHVDPLLLALQGGVGSVDKITTGAANEYTVTPRMVRDWRTRQRFLLRALPRIQAWTVIEGDYTMAPDRRATWFVDPPYWVPPGEEGARGDGYRHGAAALDYDNLAEWCKQRRGQTIVCEQDGATWLPFRPLRQMSTSTGDGGRRLEVVWARTPATMIVTPRARAAQQAAAARRARQIRNG